MPHEPKSPKPSRVSILSLPLILGVLVAALVLYMVYKVQALEARVKSVEDVISGASAQQKETPIDIAKVKGLFKKGNMVFGDAKSKVLLVEFSDPSCPFCHAAAYGANEIFSGRFKTVAEGGDYRPPVQEMRKLAEEGKAGYVVLYANGHGNGELAAQSLYCAYEQNKYWDVHGLLFTKAGYDLINDTVKNDVANTPQLVEYLSSVVDPVSLQQCLTSGKYAKKLSEDMEMARALNFSGTPMFIINTKKFAGAYNFSDMEATVQEAMK